MEHPCQSQLGQPDAEPVRDRSELVDDLEVLLEDPWCVELVVVTLHLVLAAPPVIVPELGFCGDGAGEKAVCHRAVADDPGPVLLAEGEEVISSFRMEQREMRLERID